MSGEPRGTKLRVLVIEDCADDAELMMLGLQEGGYLVTWSRVDTEQDYLRVLSTAPDVILADYTVPSFTAPRALELLTERNLRIPFIVVSGTISEEVAVDCLKRGAADYLVKDRLGRLSQAVGQALEQHRLRGIQHAAEESARQSEARFRLAFDNAPIGMAITTTDGRFLQVNDALGMLVGRTRSELLAQTIDALTHPDESPALVTYLASAGDGTSAGFDAELRFVLADGQPRWSRVSIAVLDQSEGAATRLIVQAQDIADRRRAEDWLRRTASQMATANKALRDSEQRFRSLAAAAPVGVFQADAAGQCTYTNARWQEISGLTLEQALGSGWSAMIHPDDRARILRNWSSAGVEEFADRFRVGLPDGSHRWVDAHSVALRDEAGQVTGFVGTTNDVTSTVDAETALVAVRDQAVEASRLKSQFLANMSHEIRTPMNGVLGMAYLLLETELDPTQRRYVSLLRESGETLLGVINDILDFSKVEAGKLELESVDFDVRAIVQSVVDVQSSAAHDKGLALRLDITAELSPRVTGDPGRLRQVLTNLVSNGIKYTAAGQVEIRVGLSTGSHIRFDVSDTGIGIDHSFSHLLEPFSQADTSTTRHFGGTGLGLAICRQLVELMGGTLGYRSKPGQGSTFWFDVPLPHVAAHGGGPTVALPRTPFGSRPEAVSSASAGRALVVDDSEVNQLIARTVLERMGYQVDLSSNGKDAVAAAHATRYDAILMDCLMPLMDGYEATALIRRMEGSGPHSTIVAVTASAMSGDRQKCLAAGMDDYVSKPLNPGNLANVLRRWSTRDPINAGP